MADYRHIMALLVQGHSYRQVQGRAGCSHRTIAKASRVLADQKLTTREQIDALTDEDLDRLFDDGRKAVSGEFVPVNVEAVVKARIGRKKPPLKVLWARYLDTAHTDSARFYGYERFCQIIAEHVKVNDLTSPLSHEPGHTMQVDWAGTKMQLTDPITQETTKVSLFVASLPYSGMIFAYGSLDEKLPAWCQLHRKAFEYFEGVSQLVIPDNASTASNQISRYEKARDVNQSYEAFLEYYQTAAVPTGAYKPQEKGNVEAGVKVSTNWIIHYLQGRRFAGLDELNEAVAEQVEMINDRTPFRGENRSRRDWFQDAERHELIGLPAEPWQQVYWRKAKVSRDWHVQVDTVKYSVPHQLAGQILDVRIVGEQVTVLAGGLVVASHRRGAQRHSYVTDPEHAPHGYEDISLLWTRAYFIRQATKVGPYTVQALARLLDRKKIEAQGYRSCMNILALGKGNNRALLEQACHDLCVQDERNPVSYTALKHRITALRAAYAGRPGVSAPASPQSGAGPVTAGARDTSSAHLGGISQFSLEALRSTAATEYLTL
ncbi:IS21 family transposase [Paeniglutamicibacter cryotolerans]|uniref:Transposase n=1 Tax=Paeniglutamicibacter cryotolerans TaxID=670079 RepID=A0A839QSK1_9MICC|nr:IS21 family transposase [Paeniglutamicibacter cryotolerans]MBB2995021.1 transposase [Paeniglutamicibacter cryotolerans]